GRLGMEGKDRGAQIGVLHDEALRFLDHQVHVERRVGELPQGAKHRRAEGQVGHKPAVHHIDVKPLGSAGQCGLDLFLQPSEVGAEQAGGDPHRHGEAFRERIRSTLPPRELKVPGAGCCSTTMPSGFPRTVRDDVEPTAKPASSSRSRACCVVIPTRPARLVSAGPRLTTTSTGVPGSRPTPAPGRVATTTPGSAAEGSESVTPIVRPEAWRTLTASFASNPTTSGTATGAGPLLNARVIGELGGNTTPGAGSCQTTVPLGALGWAMSGSSFIRNPALVSRDFASVTPRSRSRGTA